MIIDTAAGRSIIRRDLVRNNAINREHDYILRTATGDEARVYGEVDLNLKLGGFQMEHPFLVADIEDPCILGLDFLDDHEVDISLKKRSLILDNVEIPMTLSSETYRVVRTRRVTVEENWRSSQGCEKGDLQRARSGGYSPGRREMFNSVKSERPDRDEGRVHTADMLTLRHWNPESSKPCTQVKKKENIEVRRVRNEPDAEWTKEESRKDQLGDSDPTPVIMRKERGEKSLRSNVMFEKEMQLPRNNRFGCQPYKKEMDVNECVTNQEQLDEIRGRTRDKLKSSSDGVFLGCPCCSGRTVLRRG
uniref:Uncharacterized protein n=1 Tax=Cacopsylla melanoneura TaxID=428564 RepID=A0A8D8RAW9_9HEMI